MEISFDTTCSQMRTPFLACCLVVASRFNMNPNSASLHATDGTGRSPRKSDLPNKEDEGFIEDAAEDTVAEGKEETNSCSNPEKAAIDVLDLNYPYVHTGTDRMVDDGVIIVDDSDDDVDANPTEQFGTEYNKKDEEGKFKAVESGRGEEYCDDADDGWLKLQLGLPSMHGCYQKQE